MMQKVTIAGMFADEACGWVVGGKEEAGLIRKMGDMLVKLDLMPGGFGVVSTNVGGDQSFIVLEKKLTFDVQDVVRG